MKSDLSSLISLFSGQDISWSGKRLRSLPDTAEGISAMFPELAGCAFPLSLIPEAARYVCMEKARKKTVFSRKEDLKDLLDGLYMGLKYEQPYLLAFTEDRRLLAVHAMQPGTVDEAAFYLRDQVKAALSGGSAFVLVHNHPGGSLRPSADDIKVTKLLAGILNALGLKLIDHCIYADGEIVSLRETGFPEDPAEC
ncbi:MAG: JAB domain-containing protein [Clostridia bacterium]|nr:JAB domain-containing protein [Clostridia bacterium]